MGRIVRKQTFQLCDQQRLRSACASRQFGQSSLILRNLQGLCYRKMKTLAGLHGCKGHLNICHFLTMQPEGSTIILFNFNTASKLVIASQNQSHHLAQSNNHLPFSLNTEFNIYTQLQKSLYNRALDDIKEYLTVVFLIFL